MHADRERAGEQEQNQNRNQRYELSGQAHS
jgi:hypothetical protein